MANVDNPHGLRTLGRTFEGGCPRVMQFSKDAAEAVIIYVNDVVSLEADGNLTAGGTPGTTRFHGVSLNHGAVSTLTNHLVIVSPSAMYEAQDNNDTDGFAAADMGLNCNLEFNAGNTASLLSGHEIDESSVQTTNTLDVKLIQLLQVQGNAFGANGRIELVINKHFYREGAGI